MSSIACFESDFQKLDYQNACLNTSGTIIIPRQDSAIKGVNVLSCPKTLDGASC